MDSETNVKPETHAWVIPFITVKDPAKSLVFYKEVLGFEKAYANEQDGKVVHAEMSYMGKTVLLMTQEGQHSKAVKTPENSKVESPTVIFVYIKNVDDVYKRALSHGAKSRVEPMSVPWGERHCHIIDPDGHQWQLAEVVGSK